MLTLELVTIEHEKTFSEQRNGIITDDNHSVSPANIAMHFVAIPAFPTLKKTVICKRLIDDIVFIAIDKNSTQSTI